MGYRRRRDSRPGRAPPRASRRRHRGHRGPRVLVGVRRGSPRLPAGIGRRRPGGVRGLPRQAVPDRAGGHGHVGRRGAIALRARARHHLPGGRRRRPAAGHGGRDPGLARRRRGDAGRGVRRDPRPAQRAVARDRPRGDAHDGPGVPDGVPGGRVARAGPRARGGRVRAGGDAPRPGGRDLGEAAGQAAAAADAQALPHRAARDLAAHRLRDVPDLERLPGTVREPRDRQPGAGEAVAARRAAAGDHRGRRPRRARRGRLLAGPRRAHGRRAGRPVGGRASRCGPRSG